MKRFLLFSLALAFLGGATGCGRRHLLCRDSDSGYAAERCDTDCRP